MEKLSYQKFKGMNDIITINLHNKYTIIAIIAWKNDSHIYDVQLMLKENTIDKWDLIEDVEHLIFKTDYKHIHSAILKQVSVYLENGFFDKYIERFEYEQACFEKGDELTTHAT